MKKLMSFLKKKMVSILNLSCIKTEVALKFLKKTFSAENWLGAERVNCRHILKLGLRLIQFTMWLHCLVIWLYHTLAKVMEETFVLLTLMTLNFDVYCRH